MQNKKKLLYIVEAMGGGVFTYIVDLSNRLCDEYDVYVAYGIREQTPKDFKEYFDKRVHLIRVDSFVRNIDIIKDFKAICQVRKIVNKIKPDVIHLHSSKAGVIGRIFVSGKYKKFYTPHSYSFLMEDVSNRKKKIYYIFEKLAGRSNCTTIACGKGEYEETLKVARKAVCINNGIDLNSIAEDIKAAAYKYPIIESDADEKKFTVVTLGRICEQKNPKLFNEVAKELPEISFIWIGDGELRNELTSENIVVTGWLEREDAILEAMKGNAFMLTSLWEGLPISLLEAMYLKKVCIVSNVIGNRDVIHDDLNGYVCDTKEDFVEAIKLAMSKNNENSRLTERAYRDLTKKYNSEYVSQKYIKIYNS